MIAVSLHEGHRSKACHRQDIEQLSPEEEALYDFKIAMSMSERVLLWRFLQNATNYFEYGCGGSTALACRSNVTRFATVESDKKFMDGLVQNSTCLSDAVARNRLATNYVNIGPTGAWGYPTNASTKLSWHAYPEYITTIDWKPDLVLIDGRFRIASTLFALGHIDDTGLVVIHDFHVRPYYHLVLEFADEVDCVNTLIVLRRKANVTVEDVKAAALSHVLDTKRRLRGVGTMFV